MMAIKGWRTPERDVPCEPTPAIVLDFTNAVHVRVVLDQTPAGQQHVLPGAEKATDATIAQRRADAPLRPKKHQRPCDAGLFGDGAKQVDLL